MRYTYIFRQSSFVLFNKLHHLPIAQDVERYCLQYCRASNKEVLRLQIYLSENNIPITYTDTISLSEMTYLYSVLSDYLKEKEDSLDRVNNKGQ